MSSSREDDTEEPTSQRNRKSAEASRRNFLKVGLSVAVGLVILGVAAVAKSLIEPTAVLATETTTTTTSAPTTSVTGIQPSTPGFPVVMIANVSDVVLNKVVYFNYPQNTDDQASILVKLGVKASGGVGPDGDIVAFSQICQHLGCDVGYVPTNGSPSCDTSYTAAGPEAYCCCHGSVYDLTNEAKVIGGPAPRPLPQVILEVDSSGNIYATGMTPPTIFGYDTGSSNVSNDLQAS